MKVKINKRQDGKKKSDSDVITMKKKQVWFFWNVCIVIL